MNTQLQPTIANVVMTTTTGEIITVSSNFLYTWGEFVALRAVQSYIERENEIVRIKEDGDIEMTTNEAAEYLGYVPEYMTKFTKDMGIPYRKGRPNVYLKKHLDEARGKKETRRKGSKG